MLEGASSLCRYSFGTGVEVLPIPELVPFRLTRYELYEDVKY